MKELYLTNEAQGISVSEVESCMDELLAQYPDLKKVLIIPLILHAATLMPGKSHRFFTKSCLLLFRFM